MFPVNTYRLDRDFISFIESEKKVLVAIDLGIDPQILDIPIQNATEEIALKQGIVEWCKEDWGQGYLYYEEKKSAAERILECYSCQNKKLDLDFLLIGSLPENFYFPNLKTLLLNETDLVSWPKNFNLANLKRLEISDGDMGSILEILNNHPNLEYLSITGMEIGTLPENLSFPKLLTLDLYNNQIATFPTSWHLPELRDLRLNENQLISLPENSPYPKLKILSLEDNSDLEELPESLVYCDQLEVIDTNGTEIPEEAVERILARKEALNYGKKVAQALGGWNGHLTEENDDLRLPMEMIGEIAELGTLRGEPGEYWNRAVILAEEIEFEALERRENSSSSSSLPGARKRKREEEL